MGGEGEKGSGSMPCKVEGSGGIPGASLGCHGLLADPFMYF